MKSTFEITLKSLSISGVPEKALPLSRNLLTVEMIWPKAGTPRKSATRQITMKMGKCDFSVEPWAMRVLFREDIDGHTAFTVSIAEPVTLSAEASSPFAADGKGGAEGRRGHDRRRARVVWRYSCRAGRCARDDGGGEGRAEDRRAGSAGL